jgi:DNA mismatch repair protein MutL
LASLLACKQAVKAGTPLSPEEIASLLEHAHLAADPRYCPHGRPTTIYLSRRQLERMFDRR